jgi:predicted Zn-dependent peptidase
MAFKGTATVGTKDYAAEKPLLEKVEEVYAAFRDEEQKGARADSLKLAHLATAFKAAQDEAGKHVDSNGFTRILEENGAQGLNAFTSLDVTEYLYSLPSNKLELWALLEGSRMTAPVFREFYKERDVVYEERRMSTESTPNGRLVTEFWHAAFQAHPYGFGLIGFPSDLRTFTRKDAEAFYRRNYVAKNMCVALVGDVTLADARRHAEQYWSGISDAPAPPPIATVEPEQRAERRLLLEDPAQPLIVIGWHCPALTDPGYPAHRALGSLLAGGSFSRLYKTLVKEKKLAVQVQAEPGFPAEKYPNLFTLFVVPAAGQDPLAVEQATYDALEEIRTSKPFTDEELAGFKVRARARMIAAAESNQSLASSLAEAETFYGDWREFFRGAERVERLTTKDVMAALEKTLVRSNRTVGIIVSPTTAASAGEGR